MACYHPIRAYREGARGVRLWPPLGTENLALPCGTCIGCRTDRATQWAQRCTHEASRYEHNSFITLTYDDDHLPPEGHLDAGALQRFFKRIRKYAGNPSSNLDRDRRFGLRYFACGEYGEQTERPHYHAILFNCGFRDKRTVGKSKGRDVYHSETLAELWPYGHHKIGTAEAGAASYIAQYSLKKIGAGNFDSDGVWRPAPFLRMSLKPAIGAQWLDQHADDLQHGYLVSDGRRHGIPRTYRERLKRLRPDLAEDIEVRLAQHQFRTLNPETRTTERLEAGEQIHKRRKQLFEERTI